MVTLPRSDFNCLNAFHYEKNREVILRVWWKLSSILRSAAFLGGQRNILSVILGTPRVTSLFFSLWNAFSTPISSQGKFRRRSSVAPARGPVNGAQDGEDAHPRSHHSGKRDNTVNIRCKTNNLSHRQMWSYSRKPIPLSRFWISATCGENNFFYLVSLLEITRGQLLKGPHGIQLLGGLKWDLWELVLRWPVGI